MENSSSSKLRDNSLVITTFPYSETVMAKMAVTARDGIGLSAVQIGKMDQIFLIKETKQSSPTFYCNPKVLFKWWIAPNKETCLSLGKQVYIVDRPKLLVATYQTPKGKRKIGVFIDKGAHVFDHEFDHLQGICIDQKGVASK